MPIDAEIVEGGVWLRISGTFAVEDAAQVIRDATQMEGFVAGGRLLVDGRQAIVPAVSPERLKNLVENEMRPILKAMPHWGFLTSGIDQWELGRDVIRNSRDLEAVEFFSDLSAGLRWLTDTA